MEVVEGLYYPYSEYKGADQLRGYREADLRLCFRICKNQVFSRRGSFYMAVLAIDFRSYIMIFLFLLTTYVVGTS